MRDLTASKNTFKEQGKFPTSRILLISHNIKIQFSRINAPFETSVSLTRVLKPNGIIYLFKKIDAFAGSQVTESL